MTMILAGAGALSLSSVQAVADAAPAQAALEKHDDLPDAQKAVADVRRIIASNYVLA
jgi:hypothetical protein